jgi:hypothetical protein
VRDAYDQRSKAFLLVRRSDGTFIDLTSFEGTNEVAAVPKIIHELGPREIHFEGEQIVTSENEVDLSVRIVHIKFFGTHSTGGHSTPYLGLEIALGPGARIYQPANTRQYRKLAPGVYEVYGARRL